MRYERDFDSEIFDEEDLIEAVDECIEPDDLEEAMTFFSPMTIFNHLDEEMQNMIYEQARLTVTAEHFHEVEEEEDEE